MINYLIAVLNVKLPPGAADMDLPSGLTTLLSCSDDSMSDARNSTTLSGSNPDPSHYFEGAEVAGVDLALVGLLCECGRIFSG